MHMNKRILIDKKHTFELSFKRSSFERRW